MIDWFVLFTPLLLLALLLPFAFIGCGLDAVGSRPDYAYLHFGEAILAQTDPMAVDQRPIHQITVYWTIRGFYTTYGKNNYKAYTNARPPDTKGDPAVPIPFVPGTDVFMLTVPGVNLVTFLSISCRCDLTFDQGQTESLKEKTLPYAAGKPHLFRLVRGVKSVASPSFIPEKFSIYRDSGF